MTMLLKDLRKYHTFSQHEAQTKSSSTWCTTTAQGREDCSVARAIRNALLIAVIAEVTYHAYIEWAQAAERLARCPILGACCQRT